MIVVDTNVICYLLMPGERTAAADRLYRADPEWIAPRLWLDELLNVLATSERQAFLYAEQAAAILRGADGEDLTPGSRSRPRRGCR